jgi:hypothetical protein
LDQAGVVLSQADLAIEVAEKEVKEEPPAPIEPIYTIDTMEEIRNSRFGLNIIGGKLGFCKDAPDLRVLLLDILRYFLGFLSLIALIIVIYGGYVWATALGISERVERGKNILKWAVIGLALTISAWSIITYFMYLSSKIV